MTSLNKPPNFISKHPLKLQKLNDLLLFDILEFFYLCHIIQMPSDKIPPFEFHQKSSQSRVEKPIDQSYSRKRNSPYIISQLMRGSLFEVLSQFLPRSLPTTFFDTSFPSANKDEKSLVDKTEKSRSKEMLFGEFKVEGESWIFDEKRPKLNPFTNDAFRKELEKLNIHADIAFGVIKMEIDIFPAFEST